MSGVIVANANNSSINILEDIKGATIGSVHLADWSTSLMQRFSMHLAGVELFRDVKMVAAGSLYEILPEDDILNQASTTACYFKKSKRTHGKVQVQDTKARFIQ
jgi:hypothetical protein